QRVLDEGGGGGERLIGRGGRQHDQVDVLRLKPRGLQRLARGIDGERGGRFVVLGDIALADAGALDDPLVAGIDALRELGIGDHAARKRRAAAADDRADHFAPPLPLVTRRRASPSAARSALIRWVRSSSSRRAATATALATPAALALPWLFTTTPLRPRKTAPLWLFGSRWWRSSSVAGRETRNPILERSEL